MIEVGRLCYKIAGREAGKPCVIVDTLDKKMVLIDGLVRRKKCNINHLELMPLVLNVKKGASTNEVQEALLKNNIITSIPKKGEARKPKEKPVKQKIVKEKLAKPEKKEEKKPEKKEEKKEHKKEKKQAAKKKAAKAKTAKKPKKGKK